MESLAFIDVFAAYCGAWADDEAFDKIFVNNVPAAVLFSATVCPMKTGLVPHVGGQVAMIGPPGSDSTTIRDAHAEHGVTLEVLEEAVGAGQTTLDVDGSRFEIGDSVLIGRRDGTGEEARVAGKGSIILDRPLRSNYDAGSFVVKLDQESAALVPDPGNESTDTPSADAATSASSGDPGSSSPLPLILAIVAVFAVLGAGTVTLRRRSSN